MLIDTGHVARRKYGQRRGRNLPRRPKRSRSVCLTISTYEYDRSVRHPMMTIVSTDQIAGYAHNGAGYNSHLQSEARHLYERTVVGPLGRILATLGYGPKYLRTLCQANGAGSAARGHYAGTHTVPISHILGSENRCRDFDGNFRPLQQHTQERWINVAKARLQGLDLSPIELIQAGDGYYLVFPPCRGAPVWWLVRVAPASQAATSQRTVSLSVAGGPGTVRPAQRTRSRPCRANCHAWA